MTLIYLYTQDTYIGHYLLKQNLKFNLEILTIHFTSLSSAYTLSLEITFLFILYDYIIYIKAIDYL